MKNYIFGFCFLMTYSLFLPFSFADVCASYQSFDGSEDWGAVAPNAEELYQRFTVASDCVVSDVAIYAEYEGSEVDDATVEIWTDSSGVPASLVEAGSDISPTVAKSWATSTFSGATTLLTGTTYGIRLSRTGATSNTNYYVNGFGTTAPPYADAKRWNGTSWVTRTGANYEFVVSGGAPVPDTSSATSSIEQSQQNLAFAYLFFLLSMVIMIWLIRKH